MYEVIILLKNHLVKKKRLNKAIKSTYALHNNNLYKNIFWLVLETHCIHVSLLQFYRQIIIIAD